MTIFLSGMPERKIVIAGIGLPSRSLEVKSGVCVPFVDSDEVQQRLLLDQGMSLADARKSEFLVWTAARDYYDADAIGPCVCSGDKALCAHNALSPEHTQGPIASAS